MRDLEWKALAIADPMAIVDYVSDDNPEAAQALKEDIETKVSRLRENPRLYRVGRADGIREMVVRSNYLVVHAEAPRCHDTSGAARGPAVPET